MQLEVKRLDPRAALPTVDATRQDAGIDLRALEGGTLAPGAIGRFRTGLATAFPAGHVGLVKDRSGLASKGLHVLAGVIDPGYRGEWLVLLINLGPQPYTVDAGDRIAQVLFCALAPVELAEVEALDDTPRGAGGFGSSGR